MAVEKPTWQKIVLYWLSPALLISVGIHGLAVLLPIPEKPEIVEIEEELPEPIPVTTLPLDTEETQALPELDFVPTATPPPVEPLPPEPASQPEILYLPEEPPVVEPPAPEIPPEAFGTEEVPPEVPVTPESDGDTSPGEESSTGLDDGNTAPAPVRQSANVELLNKPTVGQGSPLEDLRAFNTGPGEPEILLENVRAVLPLKFPKANICFEGLETPTDIKLSAGVVFDKADGDQPEDIFIMDGNLLSFSAYESLNDWTNFSILPPTEDGSFEGASNGPEAIELPALADVDILDWIRQNDGPIFEPSEYGRKLVTFRVEVSVMDNKCDQPV